MCNCLKEVSAKMETHQKKQIGMEKVYSFENIGFDHQSLIFGSDSGFTGMAIGLPFTIEYWAKKKDGSKATRLTKDTVKVFMTYCPFCGEKLPQTN